MSAPSSNNSSADTSLRNWWRQRWAGWLNRRLPASQSVTLDHSKLFVLPTRAGLAFLLVIALLWLLGTNYENNLVFALTFLLVSLFAVLPVHTFANLSGLKLKLTDTRPTFAGDYASAQLSVARAGERGRERINLYWPPEEGALVDLLDVSSSDVRLAMPVVRRGRITAPRIRIDSSFPLGLFRCWSWVDLDIEFLVYPQPKSAGPLPIAAVSGEGELDQVTRSGEDFVGLKPYQHGHSLRHVAWKQFAGGRDLHSKDYAGGMDSRLWLDWDLLGGRDVEMRLSNLTAWALQAEREQVAFGLRIPGTSIDPGLGASHLQRVLTALALFPVSGVRG